MSLQVEESVPMPPKSISAAVPLPPSSISVAVPAHAFVAVALFSFFFCSLHFLKKKILQVGGPGEQPESATGLSEGLG